MQGPLPTASILRREVNTLRGLLAQASRDDNNAESPFFYQMQLFLSELEGLYDNYRRAAVQASPYSGARRIYRKRYPIRVSKNSPNSAPISPAETPEPVPEPPPPSPLRADEISLESLYLECDETLIPGKSTVYTCDCEKTFYTYCTKTDNWLANCECGDCATLYERLMEQEKFMPLVQ